MFFESIFQSFPQLKTGKLVLRKIRSEDANLIFGILADTEVTRW